MTERRKYTHEEALHKIIDDDENEIIDRNKLLIQSIYIIVEVMWIIII